MIPLRSLGGSVVIPVGSRGFPRELVGKDTKETTETHGSLCQFSREILDTLRDCHWNPWIPKRYLGNYNGLSWFPMTLCQGNFPW